MITPRDSTQAPRWRKSSRSSANGQCVEVADLGESVALRDSKNPHGPVLLFPPDGWTAFLAALRQGAGGSQA